ncbi:zinc finger HIT domain-containing protein 3 isoform X2 [Rhodnius prolixus]|uniref:Putative mynd zn-finger protein/hormone receptor interactor n=3 Tax=Rhodnius TaxID=13248 RepID=R4FKQ9_RHOPR
MTIRRICTVCSSEDEYAKYKCPNCRLPYCSANCWKHHKLEGCNKQEESDELNKQSSSNQRYLYPSEDTIPLGKLHLLRHNKKLKDIVGNPHLKTILEAVNNADDPTQMIHEAMLEPIFVEFADECLKVVQDPEKE